MRGTVKCTMSDDTPTDETSNACGPPLSSHDIGAGWPSYFIVDEKLVDRPPRCWGHHFCEGDWPRRIWLAGGPRMQNRSTISAVQGVGRAYS